MLALLRRTQQMPPAHLLLVREHQIVMRPELPTWEVSKADM